MRQKQNLTPAQGVAGATFGVAVLLLAEGHFHPAVTVALAAAVILLLALRARDKAARNAERLEELAFRSDLAHSIPAAVEPPTAPAATSTVPNRDVERLALAHAQEAMSLELRIVDLEELVADLGKDCPEFQGLRSEIEALRAAMADMTIAFFTEVVALHGANEVLRFDLVARTIECKAMEAALESETADFKADRKALAAEIHELTRQRDDLDVAGQELAGEYRATVALLEGERAAANTPPQVFEVRGVNGSARIFLAACAEEATAPSAA